jgi:hypothetical protein
MGGGFILRCSLLCKANAYVLVFIAVNMLNQQGLSPALRDDLLDHYCCVVEAETAAGFNFAEALQTAGCKICPNRPELIQTETQHLRSQSKINPMKKFLHFISFLSLVGITTGMLFKILNWPGANVLMLVGTVFFVFALLPLIFYNMYRGADQIDTRFKVKIIAGYIGFAFFAAGMLFKALHWPEAM